jgi:capsular polysaccharide biosynthesis protein
MYITARHPDARAAADIANAYASAAKRFIAQTMKTDEPSIFSVALVPSTASSISVTSYVIRGILLGTALACGLLILVFLLDSRPKSPEDVMRYANLPTLAVIPANPNLSDGKKRGKKAGRI